LFDIDGTLLSTGGIGRTAMLSAVREEFAVAEPERILFAGRTDRHLLTGLLELSGQSVSEENIRRLRTRYEEIFQRILPSARGGVLPGVFSLLNKLRGVEGCELGILTGNLPTTTKWKLRHFGLADYFAVEFHGDQHLRRTDLAIHALETLKVRHGTYCGSRICIIGDTPMDIEAAQAIGCRSLATATGPYAMDELIAYKPTHCVEGLRDTTAISEWIMG
jgi:phosphoglycolate phosphatase